jgi:hypothetical protein
MKGRKKSDGLERNLLPASSLINYTLLTSPQMQIALLSALLKISHTFHSLLIHFKEVHGISEDI